MRIPSPFQRHQQTGSALLSVVIIMPFLMLIIGLYMDLAISSFNLSRRDQYRTHAQFAADAGTDLALREINADATWAGTGGVISLHNDGSIRTTYEVSVTDVDTDTKTVTSTGRTYSPTGNTTEQASITTKTDLRAVSSGNYSIVTGVGGLYMSNSAKILGGNVLINGEVSLSNSSQIGLSTSPVTIDVAHQVCPNPATASYPQVCGPGENGEPIEITHTAHIYGTVRANNQTSTAGMSDPGLTTSSGITPQPLPTHDRAAQKAATSGNEINASAVNCNSGTRTVGANAKITGNVEISGTCQVTFQGNAWITGTLTVRNSGQMIVADTLGATRPNIMIDGSVAHFRNSALLKSNTTGTGFQILTYRSSPSCSPDCADVTGVNLYNSRNLTTINLENSASAPNTIFYARWTRVTVSNSGQIGALIGQTIQLTNTGTITFGTSIGTGTTFWVIDNYRRTFN